MYELLLHLSRRLSTGNLKNINICRLSGKIRMMDTACTGNGRLFCRLIKPKISDESCRISAEQFNVCRGAESSGVTETVVF